MAAKTTSFKLDNDKDEIRRVFNRFDTNGDGKISAAELSAVLNALGSAETSADEVSRMMHQIDIDEDGFINLEEFAGFCNLNKVVENDDVSELKEAFMLYDINKNGLISANELFQILTKLGEKCTEEDCVKMIATVDSDGDGFVSFPEFKVMMTKPTSSTTTVEI